MVCKLGPKPYLVNTSTDSDKDIPAGSIIAGFGRGKFKLEQQNQELCDDSCVKFIIDSPQTLVHFNNEVMAVKMVVDQRRKTDPLAKISYHTMEESAGEEQELGAFTIHQDHLVIFQPGAQQLDANDGEHVQDHRKPTQGFAASLIPQQRWSTHATDVIWSVKWAVNGLTPVRPLVLMTVDVTLPPGKALELF